MGTTVTGTRVHQEILRLIEEAQERVVLVSPYLDDWRDLTKAIAGARLRGVRVEMVTRDDGTKPGQVEVEERLRLLDVSLWRSPGLHLKLYFSERSAIQTSANLTAVSVGRSLEVSTRVERDADPEAWIALVDSVHQVRDDAARLDERPIQLPGAHPRSEVQVMVDREHCIRCRALVWDAALVDVVGRYTDEIHVCLPCRLESEAGGRPWETVDGRYCTTCREAVPYGTTVEKPRCRRCFDDVVRAHGRPAPAWHVQGARRRIELWTKGDLEGGGAYAGDGPSWAAVSARWGDCMQGTGALSVQITTAERTTLNILDIGLPERVEAVGNYDVVSVQRNSGRAVPACSPMPELMASAHVAFEEVDHVPLADLWEEPDMLAVWDIVGKPDLEFSRGLPRVMEIPIMLAGRQQLRRETLPRASAFLRLDLTLGIPEPALRHKRSVLKAVMRAMLASLHSYDPAVLRTLMEPLPEPLRETLCAEMALPGPMGVGTPKVDRKGRFVAFDAPWDRIAVFRVRYTLSDHFSLRGAVSTVQMPRVH